MSKKLTTQINQDNFYAPSLAELFNNNVLNTYYSKLVTERWEHQYDLYPPIHKTKLRDKITWFFEKWIDRFSTAWRVLKGEYPEEW